jgi:hypothetical protein
MESLRLRQSANMGDGQVKILIREALLSATIAAVGIVSVAIYAAAISCGAARRQLVFVLSRAALWQP